VTQEEALRVTILTDGKITAHQIHAKRPDVVIVSYEFVEHIFRPIKRFLNGDSQVRPTSVFHTEFWALVGYPIKRLILDEAHRIGNMTSARYKAVQAIPAESTALFSGTFPHNRWTGWAGPISLAKNSPFIDLPSFNHTFATYNYEGHMEQEPSMAQMRLLQRFLLRFTVARPASVLKLKGAKHYKSTFTLHEEDQFQSEEHYEKYKQAQLMEKNDREKKRKKAEKKGKRKVLGSDKKGESLNTLVHAVRAQLASMHQVLLDARFKIKNAPEWLDEDEDEDVDDDPDDKDFIAESSSDSEGEDEDETEDHDSNPPTGPSDLNQSDMDAVHEHLSGDRSEAEVSSRKLWLHHLEQNPKIVFESARMTRVLRVYAQLRKKYPTRKIVIASQYLKFLDMVKSAMRQKFDVQGLEYNGVITSSLRERNLTSFKDHADTAVPLILSGKAGGEGINIPQASIMIQCEVWWNRNAENQLYSRMLRPGQQYEVIIVRLEGGGCSIDECIIGIQSRKKTYNTLLMRPLVRPHDEPPQIPEMPYLRPFLTPS
jgi:SNF2 family DNA or RNA helicase